MTKYREILRLHALGLSQQNIADSCSVSKKTVNRVLRKADELNITWPLDANDIDAVLAEKLFNRKPGEQIEVDWAGDPAIIIDPDTGELIKTYIFVGVMTYSLYAYAEAFVDMKQKSWINAHIHMYEYFGGVAKILVPDNCKTAVIHNNNWNDQVINETYHDMAEHYGTAIIPARVRTPKDKPNAEGTVGNISTWITAALRDEQFFSIARQYTYLLLHVIKSCT